MLHIIDDKITIQSDLIVVGDGSWKDTFIVMIWTVFWGISEDLIKGTRQNFLGLILGRRGNWTL